LYRTSELS